MKCHLVPNFANIVWSPVVYFAVLAHCFASRGIFILCLLDPHDISQLGTCQFPVFVLCLKTELLLLYHIIMKIKASD